MMKQKNSMRKCHCECSNSSQHEVNIGIKIFHSYQKSVRKIQENTFNVGFEDITHG